MEGKVTLAGKVALITGSTSGIGAAAAKHLASIGCKVLICGRSIQKGQAVVQAIVKSGGVADFKKYDVTVEEDHKAAFTYATELWGGVDFVFANAGYDGQQSFDFANLDAKDCEKVISINFMGVLLTIKYATQALRKRGGGAMICTSSIGAVLPHSVHENFPANTGTVYAATKSAVDAMVRGCTNMAKESAPIRVYGLNPAVYHTAMVDHACQSPSMAALGMTNPSALAAFNPVFPGVPGNPDDIGLMVAAMFNNTAKVVPGASLVCDTKYMFPLDELAKGMRTPGYGGWKMDLSKALDCNGQPVTLTKEMVAAQTKSYMDSVSQPEPTA